MLNVDLINTLMEMKGGKVVATMSTKYNELMAAIVDVKKGGTISTIGQHVFLGKP